MSPSIGKTIKAIIATTSLTGCIFTYDPPVEVDDRLTITNHSDSTIYYIIQKNDSLTKEARIKPFLIMNKKIEGVKVADTVYMNRVMAGNTDTVRHFRDWTTEISLSKDSTLNIFFISSHILEKQNWQYIVDSDLYLERKKLTLPELQASHWEIHYK